MMTADNDEEDIETFEKPYHTFYLDNKVCKRLLLFDNPNYLWGDNAKYINVVAKKN